MIESQSCAVLLFPPSAVIEVLNERWRIDSDELLPERRPARLSHSLN